MRLSRFFIDAPLALGTQNFLEPQAHYIGRVLRLSAGAHIQVFDGLGQEYRAVLTEVSKKNVRAELTEVLVGLPESHLKIHLGQGLSRGERMDWAIQKATELGVTQVTPVITERSEVRLNEERTDKRIAHWRQIAISACEQCGRSVLPIIHPPMLLQDWLNSLEADLKLVLDPVAMPLTSHAPPNRLGLLIGPEGGLSEHEVAGAKASGFHAARFGSRVLRTETAPVVALSIAQHLWGDF